VVACEERGGARRACILKASVVDPGRVMNEANYMCELRSRGTRLLGTPEGFPEILLGPIQLSVGCHRPACFVEEWIGGGSLSDLARPGKCWSVPQVSLLGRDMVRRLQVMHTHEHSLGLVHNDIKPANVMYDAATACFYLIDLDCATAIPSIAPKKKGTLKKVQGSYAFSGIDVLGGDYPSPKVRTQVTRKRRKTDHL
jgi:serine/threonine protein kinase